MLMTFLITVTCVFVVLRWSVKEPVAANEFYTSLERMFQK